MQNHNQRSYADSPLPAMPLPRWSRPDVPRPGLGEVPGAVPDALESLIDTLAAVDLLDAAAAPGPGLSDLMADLAWAFFALEEYCGDRIDIPADDAEFRRLDAMVSAAVDRIGETPAGDLDGLRMKARLLIDSPAVHEDDERAAIISASIGVDVLRLLGPGRPIRSLW